MTDDSLRSSIAEVAENAIIVIEDIDALFAKDRSKKVEKSPLTFSGLLNALDGVGASSGQLFILTTNLRGELDPALIRNGRVDLHIEFGYAETDQMREMWLSFYPDSSSHQADEFVRILVDKLEGRNIVMASLQHFFVQQMQNTAEIALNNIDLIIEEIREREISKESTIDEDEKTNKKKTNSEENDDENDSSSSSKEVHIHIHMHKNDQNIDKEEEDCIKIDSNGSSVDIINRSVSTLS
eukprot:gene44100-58814_t